MKLGLNVTVSPDATPICFFLIAFEIYNMANERTCEGMEDRCYLAQGPQMTYGKDI
jgi:hypothetical protein